MTDKLGDQNVRLFQQGQKSLAEQANQAAIEDVKAKAPAQFRVGANWDGKTVTGGFSVDRKWSNGFGLTAYARAWWNDSAVIPQDKSGGVVGVEGVYEFKEK